MVNAHTTQCSHLWFVNFLALMKCIIILNCDPCVVKTHMSMHWLAFFWNPELPILLVVIAYLPTNLLFSWYHVFSPHSRSIGYIPCQIAFAADYMYVKSIIRIMLKKNFLSVLFLYLATYFPHQLHISWMFTFWCFRTCWNMESVLFSCVIHIVFYLYSIIIIYLHGVYSLISFMYCNIVKWFNFKLKVILCTWYEIKMLVKAWVSFFSFVILECLVSWRSVSPCILETCKYLHQYVSTCVLKKCMSVLLSWKKWVLISWKCVWVHVFWKSVSTSILKKWVLLSQKSEYLHSEKSVCENSYPAKV